MIFSWVGVGGCDIFLGGCSIFWVDVIFFWVGVGGCDIFLGGYSIFWVGVGGCGIRDSPKRMAVWGR